MSKVHEVELIPPDPDVLAILREHLRRIPDMNAEERAVYVEVVRLLTQPAMVIHPSETT
jgi:hypothetical protein